MNPIALVVQVCVGAVLGVSGPFGTQDTVAFLPRVLYWILVVYSTYGMGVFGLILTRHAMPNMPLWGQSLASGVLNGVVISTFIVSLNLLLFGPTSMPNGVWPFVFRVFLIACFVTAAGRTIVHLVVEKAQVAVVDEKSAPEKSPVALLNRLPIEKRAPLVALSVEDHYVRIKTTAGETMVLMRLSDAIGETGDTHGDQVHRSHWVAYEHVVSARREGDRAILTMSDDSEVPVSRANLKKIREAGLLPR